MSESSNSPKLMPSSRSGTQTKTRHPLSVTTSFLTGRMRRRKSLVVNLPLQQPKKLRLNNLRKTSQYRSRQTGLRLGRSARYKRRARAHQATLFQQQAPPLPHKLFKRIVRLPCCLPNRLFPALNPPVTQDVSAANLSIRGTTCLEMHLLQRQPIHTGVGKPPSLTLVINLRSLRVLLIQGLQRLLLWVEAIPQFNRRLPRSLPLLDLT